MKRKSFVAGYFYPGNKKALEKLVKNLLKTQKRKIKEKVRALIVPHAAYEYSGQVAAMSYKQIEGQSYEKVIIMATNHSYTFLEGVSVGLYDCYETPLGCIDVHEDAKKLRFNFMEDVHTTHVIEVQLPFLQVMLKNFKIIPLIFGKVDWNYLKNVANRLLEIIDEKTLLIASSDLSHYYDYNTAKKLDEETIKSIIELNLNDLATKEACSLEALIVLLMVAKKLKWKPKFLGYMNSGDVSENKYSVVGYASIVFY